MDLIRQADQNVVAASLQEATAKFDAAQARLVSDPFFAALPGPLAREVRGRNDKCIFEPLQDLWTRSGLPLELSGPVFGYLSQWVHATPYAMTMLKDFRADHEYGAVQMMIPVGLAVACSFKVLQHMAAQDESLARFIPTSLFADEE